MVGVAARVWQHASMAESTQSAMTKLRAAGVEPDPSALAALEPSVQATEPAFGPLWNAVLERARVRFTYRDGSLRTFEPWGLTSRKGRWYVVGRDVDRDATRMFKLSRITDLPVRVSRPGAYEVPEGLDLRALAHALDPQEPTAEALLAVRPGQGALAHAPRAPPEPTPDLAWAPEGYERWWVGYGSLPGMADEVAGHGSDVLVARAGGPARARSCGGCEAVAAPDDGSGGRDDEPGPGAPAAEPRALPARARRRGGGRRGRGVRGEPADAARRPRRAVDVRHARPVAGRPDRHRHGRRRRRGRHPPRATPTT